MSVFLSRPGTSELLHNIDMGVRGRARDTQKPVVKCLFFYIDPVSAAGPRFGYPGPLFVGRLAKEPR